MTDVVTFSLPLVSFSADEVRHVLEHDPFENEAGSPWIEGGAGLPIDLGFVDDVLRLVVGRRLLGPDITLAYAFVADEPDERADSLLVMVELQGREHVRLACGPPLTLGDLTLVGSDDRVEAALYMCQVVAGHVHRALTDLQP